MKFLAIIFCLGLFSNVLQAKEKTTIESEVSSLGRYLNQFATIGEAFPKNMKGFSDETLQHVQLLKN
ncbi:MAG TPA: hypothetical protein VN132_01930, partial [Bdellovibrio sp.]|nr:hypothetical protein [Bdellovibrio sp.]